MMFSLTTLGLAGAVSAAASLPTPQTIAFTDAPVQVASCAYTAIPALSSTAFGGGFTPTLGGLQISFVNAAPVAATNVRFAVTEDGRTQTLDDSGTFSTGTRIVHQFASQNAADAGLASCAVQDVSFADGTSWHANS